LRSQRSPKKAIISKMNSMQSESAAADSDNGEQQHCLTRQVTGIDVNSRSSSNSSLENVSVSEGVSCIAVVENTLGNSGRSSQIWLGTNYGSVVLLNTVFSGCKTDADAVDADVISKG
jgi:hypothetical protein